eukprot:TRINITY_DN1918_c0_g1_i2.p1 TRINITY_DN1918_c0_g1~~TRINITY_DN1918_c0_g1_i2.p1  ORF type:complete len:554 (+),score=42.61 TRINITY_DN1918_c0_g1_i2:147-1664(+)
MSVAGWQHTHSFWAFRQPVEGTIRIAVGEAHEPHRAMINHDSCPQTEWDGGKSMTMAGWTQYLEFWAFPTQRPGTVRMAVGQAHNPHRIMVNHTSKPQLAWDQGQSMTIAGWTQYLEFWVIPDPGLMRIAVGEAFEPHRAMLNHPSFPQRAWDGGQSMSVAGWQHTHSFWAFRQPVEGTIRIAVGEAHEPHRAMINHDSCPQTEWDGGKSMTMAGWTQYLEFWAFPTQRPGTVRMAVGQAHNPHRIMVNHTSKPQLAWDQGQSMTIAGWTQYLEFWVIPESDTGFGEETLRAQEAPPLSSHIRVRRVFTRNPSELDLFRRIMGFLMQVGRLNQNHVDEFERQLRANPRRITDWNAIFGDFNACFVPGSQVTNYHSAVNLIRRVVVGEFGNFPADELSDSIYDFHSILSHRNQDLQRYSAEALTSNRIGQFNSHLHQFRAWDDAFQAITDDHARALDVQMVNQLHTFQREAAGWREEHDRHNAQMGMPGYSVPAVGAISILSLMLL